MDGQDAADAIDAEALREKYRAERCCGMRADGLAQYRRDLGGHPDRPLCRAGPRPRAAERDPPTSW